jgi:diguanylate cyclase (GGDEF)-like protein
VRAAILLRQQPWIACLLAFAWAWLAAPAILAQIAAEARQAPVITLDASRAAFGLAHASEFWIDETGLASIDTVEAQASSLPFAMRREGQTHLIDGKALWLRFDARTENADARWLLEVMLAGVDLATLYYRDAQGKWVVQQAGDTLPMKDWPQAGRYPVFTLSGSAGVTHYFVRIVHSRVPFSANLQIVDSTAMTMQHEKEQFFLGAYFGLAALVVLIAGASALAYRDWGFGSYAIYVALLAAAQGAFTGVAAQYLWPGFPQLSNSCVFFLPLVAAAAAIWFVRTVTTPKQFSPSLDHFVMALTVMLLAAGFIDVMLPTSEGFTVTNTLLSASLVVMVLVIGLAVLEGDRHARWVALGFLPVMAASLFPLARNFGLLPSGFLTEYGMILASALETPILFYGLHRRLSQRREAQARARALSQTDPLTGLPHARVLLLRLQGALVRAARYQQQCGLLLVDLSNHAGLLQEYGSEAAERSLVLAASRLRSVLRDVDTAARVGAHQYALLIEAPCSPQEALDVATHAVARGLRASEVLPATAHLKFHVALAILPDGQRDAEAWLNHLLTEVRHIGPDARKTIRPVNF